ncbi:MAG: histidinol-phosphate transaminase [bacterium]
MVERRPHGGDTPDDAVDFSASLNPLGPPESVRRILQERLDLTSYPYDLRASLRETIANKHGLPPERVLIGAGTSGLLQTLLQGLQGRRLSVCVPTFTEYEDLGRSCGWDLVTHRYFPPYQQRGNSRSQWFTDSDAVVICNPNNPSGTVVGLQTMLDWVTQASRKGTKFIVDEAYMPFLSGKRNTSLAGKVTEYDNLILLRSFSKFYGIPGLRVGYLLSSPPTVSRLRTGQNPWPVGEPALRGALQCLRADSFADRTRSFIQGERQRVLEKLQSIPNLEVIDSDVNYILFKTSVDDLRGAMQEHSLYLRDASTFTGLGQGWFRLSLRERSDNDRLIDTLKSLHEDPSLV